MRSPRRIRMPSSSARIRSPSSTASRWASRGIAADALEQLRSMRGRTIVFHTALALLNARSGRCQTALVDVAARSAASTMPRCGPISTASSHSIARASVKSEALGIALFTRIASDDPTALIGLPLIRLHRHAARRRREPASMSLPATRARPALSRSESAGRRAGGHVLPRRTIEIARALGAFRRRDAEDRAAVPEDPRPVPPLQEIAIAELERAHPGGAHRRTARTGAGGARPRALLAMRAARASPTPVRCWSRRRIAQACRSFRWSGRRRCCWR